MSLSYLPTELGLLLNNYCSSKRTVKIQCMISETEFDVKNEFKNPIFEYIVLVKKSTTFGKFTDHFCTVLENNAELGLFHIVQKQDELYLISNERAEIFEKIIIKIFKHLYPKIIFAFIHSNIIYDILSDLETALNINLEKKKSIEKQLFGLIPRTEISYETRKIGREYPSFKAAFEEAQINDLCIDRIQVFSNGKSSIQFSISRCGEFFIDKGIFDVFFAPVLSRMVEINKQRYKQFKHRGRKEQPNKRPKPLIVKFGKSVFEKIETKHEFSKILDKYTKCNYSIIHSGNPHVYLSVLDRIDNSSFSVRTFGNDSLLLIPQIKTSASSLMRFSEFLFSAFHEGDIQNYGA